MTHVIFVHPHHDSAAAEFAADIAAFCRPGDSVRRVDEDVYAPKGRPDATYLAAFATFDQAAFATLARATPWEYPEAVAAFLRRPGQSRFEPIDLGLAFDIGPDRKRAVGHGWGVAVPDQQAALLADDYPGLLDRRLDLIRDARRNPHRYFGDHQVLASVQTQTPWAFECVAVHPEQRMTWGSRY